MIFDARFWKRDLKRLAASLTSRGTQRTWRDASYARLEREIMIGFYSVRRLIESHRLHEQFATIPVPLASFPSHGGHIGYFVWPEVANHFDLTKSTNISRPVEFVCNQIIHSWVFSPWFNQSNKLAGIFFSSDQRKRKEVYRLELQRAIDLFNAAAGSRPKGWLRVAPERNKQVM